MYIYIYIHAKNDWNSWFSMVFHTKIPSLSIPEKKTLRRSGASRSSAAASWNCCSSAWQLSCRPWAPLRIHLSQVIVLNCSYNFTFKFILTTHNLNGSHFLTFTCGKTSGKKCQIAKTQAKDPRKTPVHRKRGTQECAWRQQPPRSLVADSDHLKTGPKTYSCEWLLHTVVFLCLLK